MTTWLKQSTAATIVMGPLVDSGDGNTQETSLTISQADIRLSKNGAAFAQTNNSAGATHMEAGNYSVPLDTTDTNTLGRLRVAIHESGALAVWRDFMVVPAQVWDSLFGADVLQVHAVEVTAGLFVAATFGDGFLTAAKIDTDAITNAKIAADAIGSSELAASAITEIQAGLATQASLDTKASQSSVDDLPTNAEFASGLAGADDATLAAIAALNNLSEAQITAVLAAVGVNATTMGRLDVAVSTRATPADVASALTTYDGPTNAELATALGLLNDLSEAQVEAIVSSELVAYDAATGTELAAAISSLAVYIDTEVSAILADTNELQTDWTNGGRLDTLLDIVVAVANALTVLGATRLGISASTMVTGSAITGTLSTTQMTTDLTEDTDDHYNGRNIFWYSGALAGQATAISDYDGTTKTLTFVATTSAPANGDDFIIV